MKTMDYNTNGAPFEKRIECLNNRLDKVEDANKREKMVHNIQRLELKQKIQILKASKNGPRTPEKWLEILATRLDLVKMIANDNISHNKQGKIEKRMKIVQEKIIARQDKKKNQRNKDEECTTTADRNNNKNSRVTNKHRLVKQKKLLEEENDPVKRQMIANRIARIKNRIEQNEEQRSKRAELQNKICLFKNSSGTRNLSEEQHLEILSVRLELATGRLELARNCPSRRQQIEKRIEILRAKIASTVDVNAIEREMHAEEESSNEEQKNIDMKGI